ncbi:hypothetical protein [Nonomuraea sp. B19D2]|uniref:hypothetical protein n=1 Tax=Nonomuraea sp. B19D2 TaxID=3159561 RepID=UPI0032DA99E7
MQTQNRAQQGEPEIADLEWEPYNSARGGTLRIAATSCCGAVELASRAGQYLVLRPDGKGSYEESRHATRHKAAATYIALVHEHRRTHVDQGERPEYDPLVDGLGMR